MYLIESLLLGYVIDQLSQESEIKSFSDPLLNDIFYHGTELK